MGFVDPKTGDGRNNRTDVDTSLHTGVLKRNEILRLSAPSPPNTTTILHGKYADPNTKQFWVKYSKATKRVTIRATGELTTGGGSHVLLPSMTKVNHASGQRHIVWKCLREGEPDETHTCPPQLERVEVPKPPMNLLPRKPGRRRRCGCDYDDCWLGDSWVVISKEAGFRK